MLNKGDSVGYARLAYQLHIRMLWCPVSLFVITLNACTHEIVPTILTAKRLRDDMIHSHGPLGRSTVLASMAIPLNDIPSG